MFMNSYNVTLPPSLHPSITHFILSGLTSRFGVVFDFYISDGGFKLQDNAAVDRGGSSGTVLHCILQNRNAR